MPRIKRGARRPKPVPPPRWSRETAHHYVWPFGPASASRNRAVQVLSEIMPYTMEYTDEMIYQWQSARDWDAQEAEAEQIYRPL